MDKLKISTATASAVFFYEKENQEIVTFLFFQRIYHIR